MAGTEINSEYAHNVLEIIRDCENELIPTQDITDKTKLMYPAFLQAAKALEGIIKSNDSFYDKKKVVQSDPCRNTDSYRGALLYGYANNIIGFFGARGQGKTSAMLSFSNALSFEGTNHSENKNLFGGRRFYVLPPIDPTMLNVGDSVLTMVLSHLLRKVEEAWSKSTAYDRENRSVWKIMDTIRKCQNGILQKSSFRQGNTGTGNDAKKDLQDLFHDTDIMEIKVNLQQVIHDFFELQGWDAEKSMIVIQLDDTDMKLDNTYEILENVRRYLSIPNTVVLLASYLKQLRNLVAHEFENKVKECVNKFDSSSHMAAKYIDKLIPSSHMVFLPSVEKLLEVKFTPEVVCAKEGSTSAADLETYIFEEIHRKTGLVFIHHLTYAHDLIPTTLRGLAALIRLLRDMPSPCDIPERSIESYCEKRLEHDRQKLQNLICFENYFMNDWTVSRLDTSMFHSYEGNVTDYRSVLKALEHNSPGTRMLLAIKLLERLTSAKESVFSPAHQKIAEIYKDILEEKQEDARITPKTPIYIQLLRTLQTLENYCVSDEEYRFPCSLRTYFSIQLNKQALLDEIESLKYWIKNNKDNVEVKNKENIFPLQYRRLFAMMTRHDSYFDKDRADRREQINATNARSLFDARILLSSKEEHEFSWKTDEEAPKIGQELFIELLLEFLRRDLEKFDLTDVREDKEDKEKNKAFAIFALYDYIIFICCNWDVQHQLFDNISSITTSGATYSTIKNSMQRIAKEDAEKAFEQAIAATNEAIKAVEAIHNTDEVITPKAGMDFVKTANNKISSAMSTVASIDAASREKYSETIVDTLNSALSNLEEMPNILRQQLSDALCECLNKRYKEEDTYLEKYRRNGFCVFLNDAF